MVKLLIQTLMDSILLMVNLSTLPFLSFLLFSFFILLPCFSFFTFFSTLCLANRHQSLREFQKPFISIFITSSSKEKGGGRGARGRLPNQITFLIIILNEFTTSTVKWFLSKYIFFSTFEEVPPPHKRRKN